MARTAAKQIEVDLKGSDFLGAFKKNQDPFASEGSTFSPKEAQICL